LLNFIGLRQMLHIQKMECKSVFFGFGSGHFHIPYPFGQFS